MYRALYLYVASVASHTCAAPILLSEAKHYNEFAASRSTHRGAMPILLSEAKYHNKFVAFRSEHRDAAPILLSKANRNKFVASQSHDGDSSSVTVVHRKKIVQIFMTPQPSLISITVRQSTEMRA